MNAARGVWAAVVAVLWCAPAMAQADERAPDLGGRASFRRDHLPQCDRAYTATSVGYDVVFGDSAHRLLVLEERKTISRCVQAEGERGAIVVIARDFERPAGPPLYRIEAPGDSGTLFTHDGVARFYRVHRDGCCGTQPGDLYYDLRTGRLVISSSQPLARVDSDPAGWGWIGFVANMSEAVAPEMCDSTVLGVLTFAPDRGAPQRLLLRGPPDDVTLQSIEVRENARGGVIRVTLDGEYEPIELPLRANRLILAEARLPSGLRLTAASAPRQPTAP